MTSKSIHQRCWASSRGPSRIRSTPSIPVRGWTTICRADGGPSLKAAYSHSLIDDNVVYAYGSPMAYDPSDGAYDIPNCPNAPDAPAYFFCPAVPSINYAGGDYGIYDYRDPGELRIDAQGEAMVAGHVKTGVISHDLTGGGELFLRSVQQPSSAVLHLRGAGEYL